MGAKKNVARGGAGGGDTRGKFVATVSDHWQIRFKSEKVRGHREKEIETRQRFFKYLFPTYLFSYLKICQKQALLPPDTFR